MSWLFLILAGLFEAGWLFSLNKSDSFSNKIYLVLAICSMAISLYLFSLSIADISITIAYLVWLSVGVISITLIDYIWNGQALSTNQIFFLSLILIGVSGLKINS